MPGNRIFLIICVVTFTIALAILLEMKIIMPSDEGYEFGDMTISFVEVLFKLIVFGTMAIAAWVGAGFALFVDETRALRILGHVVLGLLIALIVALFVFS